MGKATNRVGWVLLVGTGVAVALGAFAAVTSELTEGVSTEPVEFESTDSDSDFEVEVTDCDTITPAFHAIGWVENQSNDSRVYDVEVRFSGTAFDGGPSRAVGHDEIRVEPGDREYWSVTVNPDRNFYEEDGFSCDATATT